MFRSFAKSLTLALALVVLPAAAVVTAAGVFGPAQNISVNQSSKSGSSTWMWNHTENGVRIKVEIKGRVEFNDDYTEIVKISDGGSISLLDERGGVTRTYEASPQADGTLKQAYWVGGASRPLDADGRAWLNRMLLETVRQSGYDAGPRVERILKQKGVNGVFEEITEIKSDYAKTVYFVELMNRVELNSSDALRLIQQTTREIASDYEKARVLMKAGERFLRDEAVRAAYLDGVNSISSDYEKSRVLQSLLKQPDLSKATIAQIVKAASRISSDYEKTRVFMQVAAVSGNDETVYTALLEAAKNVSSDHEKSRLLLKAVEVSAGNEAARNAYLEGVRTMTSDYEKSRVLQALLKPEGVSKDTLRGVIKLSNSISSDYEKARVLMRVAALGGGDESIRNAIVEASKSMSSEYERGRVLNATFK